MEDPQRRGRRRGRGGGRGRPGRRGRRGSRGRQGRRGRGRPGRRGRRGRGGGGVADRDDVVPGEGEEEEGVVADLEAGLEEDEGIEVVGGEDVGIHAADVEALVIGEEEGIQEAGDVVQGDEESKGGVMGRENVEDELSMTLPDLCAANASLWIECRAMLSAVDGNRSILKGKCAAAVGCNRFEDPRINAVEHNASTPRVGNAAMVVQYRLIHLADTRPIQGEIKWDIGKF